MTAQTTPKAPLPIATKQTARGLLRIYARLKGELAKAGDGEEVMVPPDQALAAMEHIAALMPLLGTEFVPAKLRPLRWREVGPVGLSKDHQACWVLLAMPPEAHGLPARCPGAPRPLRGLAGIASPGTRRKSPSDSGSRFPRLLAKVLVAPERDFGTLELLRHMGSGRSAGSTVLQRFLRAGLLRERRVGNQRRISANPHFPLDPEVRSMVQKTVGAAQLLAEALSPLRDRLEDAFIFGSVAVGTDRSGSDIDLALVGNVTLFDVSPLLDQVEPSLGRRVHANLYDPGEWARRDDPVIEAVGERPADSPLHDRRRAP